MKQKILISWVGINDIRGVKIEAHRTGERGPLLTLLEHFGENFFDRIFLFHTSPQEGQDSPLLMEPEALHYAPVQMHDVGAIAPTDLKAIYDVMSLKLKEFPPLELQGMFLRTLEEGEILPLGENSYRKVKVRIIAATNKNLAEEIRAGRFRKDLYYRIANYAPRLCALRAYNHADKEQLLQFLLGKLNEKYHSSQPRILCEQAKNLLLQATWPGNIREMAYRLQSICLLSDSLVTAEDVQEQMSMDALLSYVKKPAFDDDFIPNNLTQWLDEHKLLFIERAKALYKTEKAAA